MARPLDGGAARLAALVVATDDLPAAHAMAAAAGVTLAALDGDRVAARVDDFDTVIEFVTPAAAAIT